MIIAVVGAGGSYEARVANTVEAVDILKQKLEIKQDKFEKDIERLTSVYRLEPNDFETNLLAISYQSDAELRDYLKQIFSCRYYPILSYEILAHLLKHKFIDLIINFNFDELLDQAIDDEFGAENYYKIISDGDYPEELLANDFSTGIEAALYIKPHGTSSHPSTLRFTREDYFGLPKGIKAVLEKILIDSPVIMVNLGFGMQSFEFNQIAAKSPPSKIFYFNITTPDPDPPLRNYTSALIDVSVPIEQDVDQEYSEVAQASQETGGVDQKIGDTDQEIDESSHDETGNNLSQYMEILWDYIVDQPHENYFPRQISRHKIVSKILASSSDLSACYDIDKKEREDSDYRLEYLENRKTLELIFSIAKAKGLINISALEKTRCGKYFDLCHREKETEGIPPNEIPTLPMLCKNLGFREIEYGMEVFIFEEIDKRRILSIGEFDQWVDRLLKKNGYIENSGGSLKINDQKFFKSHLKTIFNGAEVEIYYNYRGLHEKIFVNPIPIKTSTSMKDYTIRMLNNDWDSLFIVAETGEWILDKQIVELIKSKTDSGPKNIFMIIADSVYANPKDSEGKKGIKDVYENIDVNINIKDLPCRNVNLKMTPNDNANLTHP